MNEKIITKTGSVKKLDYLGETLKVRSEGPITRVFLNGKEIQHATYLKIVVSPRHLPEVTLSLWDKEVSK